ncbi:type III polyketide synthase [Metabacillus sp. KIGAM252]|uniref:Type III polyketide synthase n=1 Tax=Metabacillus flavus TaxID=2823519 RepID=A0ABS5LF21_9BACI|nr:3-oxoacyl-[acyl-carrier-protein] synthase III C-terminal domain-containing protein [Metabacillus flavus]MBS2969347.1 type III polyketide synthase [Metabacillus flavus]
MGYILSCGTSIPPYHVDQETGAQFAEKMFEGSFKDLPRLLKAFQNGEIESRQFVEPLDWYTRDHAFDDKNSRYIKHSVEHGVHAIENALTSREFLNEPVDYSEIDAIFFISTTGLSTPSIDARIMNKLPFKENVKRIPIWGLGCAGGASALSRALDYCTAYPEAAVLVLAVELCSLTFQRGDLTKSNLIGTSLFADGIACMLIAGNRSHAVNNSKLRFIPKLEASRSVFMRNSEEVMGWDIQNDGLHVIFSRDIPSIIQGWLGPNVRTFLQEQLIEPEQIGMFLAHPGGKKVLDAYLKTLNLNEDAISHSRDILKMHGNMSSATVFYVIEKAMKETYQKNPPLSLSGALGPGFCAELLLISWEETS